MLVSVLALLLMIQILMGILVYSYFLWGNAGFLSSIVVFVSLNPEPLTLNP